MTTHSGIDEVAGTTTARAARPGAAALLRRAAAYLPAAVVLVVALGYGSAASPYFLDPLSLMVNTGRYVEIGLLAVGLTLVILHGDIDLSVASNLAAGAAVLGLANRAGLPIAVCCLAAIVCCVVLGAVNGLLVVGLGLPSLVVTLATLAAYRGIAQVLLGDSGVTQYPEGFVGADQVSVVGDAVFVPIPLVVLLLLAALAWFATRRTTFGLGSYLIGSNPVAAAFTGIRTDRIRFLAFVASGAFAGVAAVLITSRLGSTLSNVGQGLELLAITVVVLGGTDIAGGRGTIGGTLLALFAVMAVREALVINNVNGQVQDAVIGVLLVASIVVPRMASAVTASHSRRLRAATASVTSSPDDRPKDG